MLLNVTTATHATYTRTVKQEKREKKKSMTTPFFQTLFMSFGYQSIVHSFRLAVQRNQRRRPGMPGCRVEKRPLWERGETKKKKKRGNKETALMYSASCAFLPFFLLRRHRSKEDGGGGGGAALLFLRVLLHSCLTGRPVQKQTSQGGGEGGVGRVIRTVDGGGSGARRGGGCTHSEPVSGALDVERAPTEITTNTRHGHKAAPRRSHSKVLFFSCFSFPFIK